MKRFAFSLVELRLAVRNVTRQRARTALTLSVIAVGVAGLILSGGFVEDALRTLRESTIHAQIGHLQLFKSGFNEHGKSRPYEYLIPQADATRQVASTLPGVVNVMSRLSFAGVLNNGKSDLAILGEGIEPAAEAKLGTQIQMVEGRPLKPDDRFGLMAGEGVAAGAGIHVGSVVNLLLNTREGALNNLEFTVVGIFRTFSKDYDARGVRVSLNDAQELMASPTINAIVVELGDTASTDSVAGQLRERLEPAGMRGRGRGSSSPTSTRRRRRSSGASSRFLQAIILLSVLLAVANSVNMTIFERTGEFGTLMAIGTRRVPIFRLVMLENLIVGFAGQRGRRGARVLLAGLINALHIADAATAEFEQRVLRRHPARAASPCSRRSSSGSLATPLTALWPALAHLARAGRRRAAGELTRDAPGHSSFFR